MLRYLIFVFLFFITSNVFATQLILQLKNGMSIDVFIKQYKADFPALSFEKTLSKSWNIYLLEIPETDRKEFIKQAYKAENIIHIQGNRKASPRQTVPNDSGYAQQWHHNNTGVNGGTAGVDMQSEWAWDIATGANGVNALGDTIVIAVVDEGVDLQCDDLNLWKNHQEIPNNNIDDDNNGYIDDYDGWNAFAQNGVILAKSHGTKVASIAAAIGNNNNGIAGLNWNAQIMPVAVNDYSEAEIVIAYSYLFDQRKLYNQSNGTKGAYIAVANSSFGIDNAFESDYPLWCALYDSLGSVGILSVSAATNIPTDVDRFGDIPSVCSSPYLIAVTSSDRNDQLAAAGYGKKNIDLAAPGVAIYSIGVNNFYGSSSGTSYAAPQVAGLTALMYAAACDSFFLRPHDAPLIVKKYIEQGAKWHASFVGKVKTNGRLNAFKSLELFLSDQCVTCMDLNISRKEITCIGSNDAEVEISVDSANFPLTYNWNDIFSDSIRYGIKTGQYYVTVTDSNNCQKVYQFNFQNPEPISISLSSTAEINDSMNGKITSVVSGGRPPYSFEWSNGDTLDSLSNLGSAWYYLTLRDQNGTGCLAVDSVFVEKTIIDFVEEIDLNYKVFPNPAKEKIYLQFENLSSVQLLDLNGNLLKTYSVSNQSTLEINRNNLASGLYLLKLENERGINNFSKVILY